MKTVHRLAHGFLLVILALPLLLATPGCTRQTGTTHPTSPAMHLKAAQAIQKESPDDLALAAWNYEKFLQNPGNASVDDLAMAKMQLGICLRILTERHAQLLNRQGKESSRREWELKAKLLQTQNDDLNRGITRLNAENAMLRQTLLRVQEKK